MIIVGLDPSTTQTGYAVVGANGREPSVLEFGQWKLPTKKGSRLLQYESRFLELLDRVKADYVAIERPFLYKSVRALTALSELGAVSVLVSEKRGIKWSFISPREARAVVVGWGGAGKKDVKRFLEKNFKIEIDWSLDAADAVIIALACFYQVHGGKLVVGAT